MLAKPVGVKVTEAVQDPLPDAGSEAQLFVCGNNPPKEPSTWRAGRWALAGSAPVTEYVTVWGVDGVGKVAAKVSAAGVAVAA